MQNRLIELGNQLDEITSELLNAEDVESLADTLAKIAAEIRTIGQESHS